MEKVKPIYKNLFIAAAVMYVLGMAIMLSDIYYKVVSIEHDLEHIKSGTSHSRHVKK